MTKLLMPITCECGYTTIDAEKAIQHIKEKHPELWQEQQEDNSNETVNA
jgi:hypothetical protein